ncbi:type II secretion system F family protein [Micromonosporaceae bacterium Da 78-11]
MSSLPAGTGWAVAGVVSAAAAVFLLAFALLDVIFGRTKVQRRLSALRLFTAAGPKKKEPALCRLRASAGEVVGRSPALTRFADRSSSRLERAGSDMRPTEWLALRLLTTGVGAVVAGVLLPLWFGLPLGLIVGFVQPAMLLRARIKRRQRAFADELPSMLQLLLSSLRSGFTLQQSVEAAVRDDDGPVAEELSRALSETRINGEFEDALGRVGDRIGSTEMVWLVMALRLQREVGGSLAEVMQTTANTMRERAYLRRHVSALSAEGRISAYILAALPVGVSVMLGLTRPEYLRPLITEPVGILMLLSAGLLLAVGAVWLRSSVKIEI